MKVFANDRYLRTSSLPLRVTLSWFLLFVGLGYATNFAILAWKTGMTPTGIALYYRGDEAAMQFPKEFHELLENLHFHVYIVPLVLLVLTHVFYMTTWSERAKLRATMLAYTAALADLAGPFLVRYAGAGFAWWKLGSACVYHATLFFLVLVPLWETWFGRVPVLEGEVSGPPSPGEPTDL
ncbi:MAG TPA: hypothetical protein VMW35_04175 [Myxococcota bacterium]|jgi:hypothetical protein|nr:hypothetical protein [Myxococcota bacterium]